MIQEELSLDLYMKEVSKIPVLSREEEIDIFKRLKKGDESAREEIVRANLRFVVKIANSFLGQGMTISDLIQEGNLGLLEVIDKYDYRRGFRFSTYAAFWIRQSIQMALRRQRGIARLPVRKSRLLGYINEAILDFAKIHGREPMVSEIAEELHVQEEKVEELMQYRKFYGSLDEEQSDSQRTLLDTLSSEDTKSPREVCHDNQLKIRVWELLKTLSERERRILGLRFGFLNGTDYSLRNTSKVMGLSQEGVRRIEKKALAKLHRPAMQTCMA
jgi:RNA polymerase primary sigma factor